MKLTIHDVSFSYQDTSILNHIDLAVEPGEIMAILGPNGSGKTTLLKTISKVLTPKEGAVYIDSQNISKIPISQLAYQISAIEQHIAVNFDFTVQEIVGFGRIPHRTTSTPEQNQEAIYNALKKTHILHLQYRLLNTLSSGERQRVWLAMALSQKPSVLLLDEPTSHLDIHHQLDILQLIQSLAKEGLTVIMAIHNINLAMNYAHRIALMKQGKVIAFGIPEQILTESLLDTVFEVKTKILKLDSGKLCIAFEAYSS